MRTLVLHTAHVDVLLGCAGSECQASIRGTGDPPTCCTGIVTRKFTGLQQATKGWQVWVSN